jgi:ABC-type phosphate/phosphonate transport system substrate-binding protein
VIPKSTRVWLISAIGIVAFILSGCSSTIFVVPTPIAPTVTSTPLSTALPTVSTQVPLGASDNPYHMAVVGDKNSVAGDALATYLAGQLGPSFQIDFLPADADALSALCNGKASFVWLDGTSLLAALAQNCGSPALKYQMGTDNRTGIRTDLVVRSGGKADPAVVAALKGHDVCRLTTTSGQGGQDPISWILPLMLIRAAGLDPAQDIRARELPDTPSMLQAVADGTCAAAGIPSGTLSTFNPTVPAGDKLVVLQTSPELPYGGLVISNLAPADLSAKTVKLLADLPSQLSAVIKVDGLSAASVSDYADFQTVAKSAGINLKTLGK